MQNEFDEYPRVSALVSDARQIIDDRGSIGDLKGRLRDVLSGDELVSILTSAVQQFTDNPAANPAMMQQENIVLCNDFNGLLLAIGRTEFRSDAPIYTSSSDALIGAATAKGFSYRQYTMSEHYDNEVFDPSVEIVVRESGLCTAGDSVLFPKKGASEYGDSGSLVMKVVNQRSAECMMWEFDRLTRRARRAYAADVSGTTMRYLLRFLSEFGNARSVGAITRLLSHPYHYVRWDAVKAIGALDAGELEGVLGITIDDPHPHVRKASQRMIEQLKR